MSAHLLYKYKYLTLILNNSIPSFRYFQIPKWFSIFPCRSCRSSIEMKSIIVVVKHERTIIKIDKSEWRSFKMFLIFRKSLRNYCNSITGYDDERCVGCACAYASTCAVCLPIFSLLLQQQLFSEYLMHQSPGHCPHTAVRLSVSQPVLFCSAPVSAEYLTITISTVS